MNYIVLLWAYGHGSVKAIINKMEQPCNALMKKKNGEWVVYSPATETMEEETQSISLESLMKILHDSENKIINWGSHIFSDDSLFDLQPPKAVALASNKRLSRKVLQNAGICVPKTWFLDSYAILPVMKYPIIARPSHHHGGKHFHIIENEHDFCQFVKTIDLDWYFSAVFPKTNEYRLHVTQGRILAMYEKPLIPGEIRGNYSVNQEAWRVLKWHEYNAEMSRQCILAVEALGLDYGAVDIMYDSVHDSMAIAEVNTSPQTTWSYLSTKYAAYFDWVIRHGFPAHFEPDGTSVFYNSILRDEKEA